MQTAAVIRATAREILRRRAALAALVALPLAFYLARHEMTGQSIRMLCLGLAWAIATLALFTTVSSRDLDRRLRVFGYRWGALTLGRLAAVILVGLTLAAAYVLLILLDQDLGRPLGVVGMLALAVLIGAPLGQLVGALLGRELEGALVLLSVLAMQMIADPDGTLAKLLPFWSIRQLGTWTVDGVDSSYLSSAVGHGAISLIVLWALVAISSGLRLRMHRAGAVAVDSRTG